MMDANDNATKMIIATAIYLLVAIMVAAGLTLKGAHAVAGNESTAPASFQQAGVSGSGKSDTSESAQRKASPADEGRFDGIDAKMFVAPAVQAIIRSKPRIVF